MPERSDTGPQDGHALEITRLLDAPRALVFSLWSRPEHMLRWWGPREDGRDYTTPLCEMDFRPGGQYRICIRSPGGRDSWQRGEYREIDAPKRLVFSFQWDNPGQTWPETLVTVDFTEHGPKQTLLRFRQTPFDSEQSRDSHRGGWGLCLDRLADHILHRSAA